MLTIRLSRVGKKNKAQFRLILQEKTQAPKSQAKEILGHYDPHNKKNFALKKDRIQFWLSKGAKPSATVNNFFINQGLITGKKQRVVRGKKKAVEAAPAEKPTETAPTEAKK